MWLTARGQRPGQPIEGGEDPEAAVIDNGKVANAAKMAAL